MTDFKGFSEAAKLYAKNIEIVDAMRACFEEDITSYVEAIAETVRDSIDFGSFQTNTTRGFRYWWIGGEDYRNFSRLWFKSIPPFVLLKSKIVMYAETPRDPPGRVQKVEQLVGNESLKFVRKSNARYSVIRADICCDEHQLDVASRQIVALLRELHRIDLEFPQ